jgi:hypothetical protein
MDDPNDAVLQEPYKYLPGPPGAEIDRPTVHHVCHARASLEPPEERRHVDPIEIDERRVEAVVKDGLDRGDL